MSQFLSNAVFSILFSYPSVFYLTPSGREHPQANRHIQDSEKVCIIKTYSILFNLEFLKFIWQMYFDEGSGFFSKQKSPQIN